MWWYAFRQIYFPVEASNWAQCEGKKGSILSQTAIKDLI